MPDTTSTRIKHKNIQKLLKKLGYSHYDMFYSPMAARVCWMLGVIVVFGGILVCMLSPSVWLPAVGIAIICYFCLFCIITAYSHNSFVLTPDDLVSINPNVPYKKYTVIPLNTIVNISIGIDNALWRKPFLFVEGNYADVQTRDRTKRFHCVGLDFEDFEDFEGNGKEIRMDDLMQALEQRNVVVIEKD